MNKDDKIIFAIVTKEYNSEDTKTTPPPPPFHVFPGELVVIRGDQYGTGWFKACPYARPQERGFLPNNVFSLFDPKLASRRLTMVHSPNAGKKQKIPAPEPIDFSNYIKDLRTNEKKTYWEDVIDQPEAKDVFDSISDWKDKFAEFVLVDNQVMWDRVFDIANRAIIDLNQLKSFRDKEQPDKAEASKIQVYKHLEEASTLLNEDLVVRVQSGAAKGQYANEVNSGGVVKLYRMHWSAAKRAEEAIRETERLRLAQRSRSGQLGLGGLLSALGGNIGQRDKNEDKPQQQTSMFNNLPEGNMQMHMLVDNAIFTVGEPVEIFFSLYSVQSQSFISENYCIKLPSMNREEDSSAATVNQTLFKDIGSKYFKQKLWLVIRAFRRGIMLPELKDTVKAGSSAKEKQGDVDLTQLKRPLGVAIFELTSAIVESLISGETLQTGNLQVFTTQKEEIFTSLHETLIRNNGSNVGLNNIEFISFNQTRGINISFSAFTGEYDNVMEQNKSFLRGCSVTQMIGFPETISPGDRRNDIYIHLSSLSNVKKIGAKEPKNLMLTVKVFVEGESEPQKVIVPYNLNDGPFLTDRYSTAVYYHIKNPKFNETVRITIEPHKLEKAYVVFTVSTIPSRHISDIDHFGISYWKIIGNKGLIQAEPLDPLTVYKHQFKENEIVSFNSNAQVRTKFHSKINLHVEHILVSTRVTQNENLKNLLDYQNVKKPMEGILKHYLFVRMEEIVTFLREIFEALFSILSSKEKEERDTSSVPELIFQALVNIISSLVSQLQFKNYREIMDEYISKYFKSSRAHHWILHFIRSNLENMKVESRDSSKLLSETMKAMNYLFQFVVVSYKQGKAERLEKIKQNPQLAEAEKKVLEIEVKNVNGFIHDIMTRIKEMMVLDKPKTIIAAQGNLLKFIDDFFDSVAEILEDDEKFADMVNEFITSIPAVSKNMITGKLNALSHIVRGEAFKRDGPRASVFQKVSEVVSFHLARSEQERASCIEIVLNILRTVQTLISQRGLTDAIKDTMYNLFSLIQTLQPYMDQAQAEINDLQEAIERASNEEAAKKKGAEGNKDAADAEADKLSATPAVAVNVPETLEKIKQKKRNLSDMMCCVLALINIYNTKDMLEYHLQQDAKYGAEAKTLQDFITLYKYLPLKDNIVPENWLSFHAFVFQTLHDSLSVLSSYMVKNCLSEESFNSQVWDDLLTNSLFEYMCLDSVNYDLFITAKRLRFTARFGDYRLKLLTLIQSTWNAMGPQQKLFVPSIVNPILRSYKQLNSPQLRSEIVQLYYTVLHREYDMKKSLESCESVTQRTIVDMDDASPFLVELESKFAKDAILGELGNGLLRRLRDLLALVSEINKYKDEDEYNKTHACVKVMEYFNKHENKELYYKYAHTLSQVHVHNENFVEAAIALDLHAQELSFTSSKQLSFFSKDYPAQLEFKRKEELYRKMINLYDQGKDFERAIILTKQLREHWEKNFKFSNLENLLKTEGGLYTKIMTKNRIFAEYYVVTFYGKGARDMGLEGKYIFRSKEGERIAEFCQVLKKKFAPAEYLQKSPKEDLTNAPGAFFEVTTVNPSNQSEFDNVQPQFVRNISPKITKYFLANNVNMFYFKRPFHPQNARNPNPADLCREITFYIVKEGFPTYARRQKVESIQAKIYEPVINALLDIEERCSELVLYVNNHELDEKPDTNQLSRTLSGTIDAAVNGGILKYLERFFSTAYLASANCDLATMKRFQFATLYLMNILDVGLKLLRDFVKNAKALQLSDYLEKLQATFKHAWKAQMETTMEDLIKKAKQVEGDKQSTVKKQDVPA